MATQRIAEELDVAVPFSTWEGLAERLRDRPRVAQLGANMRAARHSFTFDAHVDQLVAFAQDADDEVYALSLSGGIYRLDASG